MRRRLIPVLVVVFTVLAAVGYAMAQDQSTPVADADVDASPAAVSTAEVVIRDMVATEELTGTLGFGEARSITAAADGVVTSAATVGELVGPGDILAAVNLEPIVLLEGSIPMFRSLDSGVDDGPDVAQLEEWLVAAGHADDLDLTVDQTFTGLTALAVQAWETALGRLDPDGEVGEGDVVFTPGTFRVDSISSGIGSRVQAGSELLRVTGTDLVVTVDLDTDDLDQLPLGGSVQLRLPDDTPTTGTVQAVGVDAEADTDAADEADPADPTVPVIIVLDDPAVTDIESGTVAVTVETAREDDVVAVDVTALVALAEGGYAVEVVDGGTTSLVAVDIGTFADGFVAVAGVQPGTTVVVPS